MVSGLFIPVLFGLYGKNPSERAALLSMVVGGGLTLGLTLFAKSLPLDLDPIAFGLVAALLSYLLFSNQIKTKKAAP